MSRFKQEKDRLLLLLQNPDWQTSLAQALSTPQNAKICLNPLLSFLNRPELRDKAAHALGLAVALIAEHSMEDARILMRRLMWSMNEESGNLGWGIPEAMGCILAESPPLAGEYARILISYGRDTAVEGNFVDHAPLRRGVYWGIARLAFAHPALVLPALPTLTAALADEDPEAAGMAAFALSRLATSASGEAFTPAQYGPAWQAARTALAALAKKVPVTLALFDNGRSCAVTTDQAARSALRSIENGLRDAAAPSSSDSLSEQDSTLTAPTA